MKVRWTARLRKAECNSGIRTNDVTVADDCLSFVYIAGQDETSHHTARLYHHRTVHGLRADQPWALSRVGSQFTSRYRTNMLKKKTNHSSSVPLSIGRVQQLEDRLLSAPPVFSHRLPPHRSRAPAGRVFLECVDHPAHAPAEACIDSGIVMTSSRAHAQGAPRRRA